MSKKQSNTKFILGIAVALLVPLFCFFVVTKMSEGRVKMPGHYFIDRIADQSGKRDTIYHQAADIVLTNQLGRAVSLNKDLQGKILVVDFFSTTCEPACSQLSRNMRQLQTSFKKDTKKEASLDTVVQFISITVDPDHDSFPALRAYADKYGANHDHWWLLTGDKKTIYNYASNELQVATNTGDSGENNIIHSKKFVLLDKNRQIRGYYNGLDDTAVRRCADDIVLLTLEKTKGAH